MSLIHTIVNAELMMHTWIIVPFFPESKKDLKFLGAELHCAMEGALHGEDEAIQLK